MAGCRTIPDPCDTPDPDPPTPEEEQNCDVVRQFIDRVWNYRWTRQDNKQFVAERRGGNALFVPPAIEAALRDLRSSQTVRHRRDGAGNAIRSSGPDDYRRCINAVHAVVQSLNLTISDIRANGDRVIVSLILEGIDRHADPRAELRGAFGVGPPTGKKFRLHSAMLYRIERRKVAEDWLLYGNDITYSDPMASGGHGRVRSQAS